MKKYLLTNHHHVRGLSARFLPKRSGRPVKGMVCAFCATGIEKTFRKQPEVESVKVDLPRRL